MIPVIASSIFMKGTSTPENPIPMHIILASELTFHVGRENAVKIAVDFPGFPVVFKRTEVTNEGTTYVAQDNSSMIFSIND